MSRIAVGVVGTGGIARESHLPAYADDDRVKLLAVADLSEEARESAAADYDVPNAYASGEEMLEREPLDAVSICTPPSSHAALFRAAAERGIHVYCEKPVAPDVETAREMAALAADNDVITQMGYAFRYSDNYERVRKMVQSGLLGDVLRIDTHHVGPPPSSGWYYDPELSGGGVLCDKLPHDLDFQLSLFETRPEVVRSRVARLDTRRVEDYAEVELAFGSTRSSVTVGWNASGGLKRNVLVGTEGTLRFDPVTLKGSVRGQNVSFKCGDPPTVKIGPLFEQWFGTEVTLGTERITDFVDHVAAGDRNTSAPIGRGVELTEIRAEIYAAADGSPEAEDGETLARANAAERATPGDLE